MTQRQMLARSAEGRKKQDEALIERRRAHGLDLLNTTAEVDAERRAKHEQVK